MNQDLVSIITALYNAERFIGQTIESVLAQTYTQWEMIIVNDGSTDRSEQIALSYAQKDNRIKILSQPNAGSAAARNKGIRAAQGRFLTLLDADDMWDSDFLDKQLCFMRQHDAQLVCSAHRRIDENNQECLKPFFPPEEIRYTDLLKTCSISCLTAVYDTKQYGKFYLREDLKSLRDDYVLWLELIKKVGIVYGNQQVIASYRMVSTQLTAKKRKMVKPQYRVYREIEKLSQPKSLYYTICWAIKGIIKYRK